MARDLAMKLSLDSSGFQEGLEQGASSIRGFNDAVNGAAQNVDNMKNVTQMSTKELLRQIKAMESMAKNNSNFKRQLAQLTKEVTDLTVNYSRMTDEEKSSPLGRETAKRIAELKLKAADFKDTCGDVADEIRKLASDTANWDAMSEGIDATSSALQGMIAIANLGGVETEKLVNVMAKLQQIQVATNAVIKIGNILNKSSISILKIQTIQTKALQKAEAYERLTKIQGTNATIAATVAQKAFNMVAKANPYVLLATAIIGVSTALYGFISMSEKSAKAEEERTKAAEKAKEAAEERKRAEEEFRKSVGDSTAKSVSKYKELQKAYKECKTTFEKTQWINENRTEIENLGLSVKNLTDAENVFATNTEDIVKGFRLRAQAAAYAQKATDLYSQKIQKQMEIESKKVSAGDTIDVRTGKANIRYGSVGRDGIWRFSEDGAQRYNAEIERRMQKQLDVFDKDISKFEQTYADLINEAAALGVSEIKSKGNKKSSGGTATNENAVQKALSDRAKTEKSLTEQLKNGIITQKDYDDQIEKADESLYKVMTENLAFVRKSKKLSAEYDRLTSVLKNAKTNQAKVSAINVSYNAELNRLKVLYQRGIITEEEYYSNLEKLSDKYADEVVKVADVTDSMDDVVDANKEYKRQAKEASKKLKEIKGIEYESISSSGIKTLTTRLNESVNDFVGKLSDNDFVEIMKNGNVHKSFNKEVLKTDDGAVDFTEYLDDLRRLTAATDNYIQLWTQAYSGVSAGAAEWANVMQTHKKDDILQTDEKKQRLKKVDPNIDENDWDDVTKRYSKMNKEAVRFAEIWELATDKMDVACTLCDYMFNNPIADVELLKQALDDISTKELNFNINKDDFQLLRDCIDDISINNLDLTDAQINKLREQYNSALDNGKVTEGLYTALLNAVTNPELKQRLQDTFKVSFDENGANEVVKNIKEAIKTGRISDAILEQIIKAVTDPTIQGKLQSQLDESKDIKVEITPVVKKGYDLRQFDVTKERVQNAQNMTDSIIGLGNAYRSLYDTLNNSDASGWDKITATFQTLSTTVDTIYSLIEAIKTMNDLLKASTALSKAKAVANQVEAGTEVEKASASAGAAVAGATESGAKLPYPWNLVAIAAGIAAVMAALANMDKFANGGIVGKYASGGLIQGKSLVGDQNLARVNSGELIMNGTQQKRLWNIINGSRQAPNTSVGGEVKFRIEGQQLVGVLNNYNKKVSKIM